MDPALLEAKANMLNNWDDSPSPAVSVLELVKKFCFKSVAWIGIYLLGYYDFSIAWLLTPLLLTVLRRQWKKERDRKLSAAREAALTSEKVMIESRIKVEDLPSWVFFPDKERAEWVNSVLHQLWPNVGHYVRRLVAESIEPAVKNALEHYGLGDFRFERVILGQIPPRITGVKVYDKNTNRNEIIMDLDLIFASDCDIKFLIKGMKAKVNDFSLRGLVRVVLKPLVSEIPLIGGVQVFFLAPPEVEFDLGGFANALDVPGLSSIVRRIVVEQIGAFMVLPNKFSMPLIPGVHQKELKCPDSAGVLRVNLIKAENLLRKDIGVLGTGKSDPYVVLGVGARKYQTERIKNSTNPEWNFFGDFPIEIVHGQELILEVWDHDDPGEDEFLGRATVATDLVAMKGAINNMWVELKDVKAGRVLLSLTWLEVGNSLSDLEAVNVGVEDKNLAKCLLHVYLDSCRDLKQNVKKPSPMVEMNVGVGETQTTFIKTFTLDPVFEQGFVFLVANPVIDDLHIKVLDSTAPKSHQLLGTLNIPMSSLLHRENMEIRPPQPFVLENGFGTVILSLHLKTLRVSGTKVKTTDVKVKMEEGAEYIAKEPVQDLDANKMMISDSNLLDEVEETVIGSKITSEEGDGRVMFMPSKDRGPSSDEMELRRRSKASSPPGNHAVCGKIQLSLLYEKESEKLHVTIHEAKGLPGGDLPDPPDPYVKLYLLPDRSKRSKRKSDVKKDTVHPVYEESFTYSDMSPGDMSMKKLEVSVVDRKGIFARGSLMGRTIVDLYEIEKAKSINTEWFQLYEDDDDSD